MPKWSSVPTAPPTIFERLRLGAVSTMPRQLLNTNISVTDGSRYAAPAWATTSATVARGRFMVGVVWTGGTGWLEVWDDDAVNERPGVLLARADVSTLMTTAGERNVALSTSLSVTAGTKYWLSLGFVGQVGGGQVRGLTAGSGGVTALSPVMMRNGTGLVAGGDTVGQTNSVPWTGAASFGVPWVELY